MSIPHSPLYTPQNPLDSSQNPPDTPQNRPNTPQSLLDSLRRYYKPQTVPDVHQTLLDIHQTILVTLTSYEIPGNISTRYPQVPPNTPQILGRDYQFVTPLDLTSRYFLDASRYTPNPTGQLSECTICPSDPTNLV